eukprot:TRINITY_DN549_c1_g2_i1.p1 TRINITY_DN549_c1_g2~~TRINITY_DN549_c1_g2_i1.p1  ORF type:complete len:501 (-),score=165.12 TRINITY_DN549_c1_g2_i1:49-1551(-)
MITHQSGTIPFIVLIITIILPVRSDTISLTGNVTTDSTWVSSNNYILNARVTIKAGVTLSIQPGTKIQASSQGSLIIEPNAKIIANGTAQNPITFTTTGNSVAAGQWNGIVLLGNAPVASSQTQIADTPFGGNQTGDSSGILSHVRIWFAGQNQSAALILGGVGNGTTIDSCEVGWSAQHGIDIIGGTINLKRVSSILNQGASFQWNFGHVGENQFLLGVTSRDPAILLQTSSTFNLNGTSTFNLNSTLGFTRIWSSSFVALGNSPLVQVSSGFRGNFGNNIFFGKSTDAWEFQDCSRSQVEISHGNIFWNFDAPITCLDDPEDYNSTFQVENPGIFLPSDSITNLLLTNTTNLLPDPCGISWKFLDAPPNIPGNFYESVSFKGAFGLDYNFLRNFSYLWPFLNSTVLSPCNSTNSTSTSTPTSTSDESSPTEAVSDPTDFSVPGHLIALLAILFILLLLVIIAVVCIFALKRKRRNWTDFLPGHEQKDIIAVPLDDIPE